MRSACRWKKAVVTEASRAGMMLPSYIVETPRQKENEETKTKGQTPKKQKNTKQIPSVPPPIAFSNHNFSASFFPSFIHVVQV